MERAMTQHAVWKPLTWPALLLALAIMAAGDPGHAGEAQPAGPAATPAAGEPATMELLPGTGILGTTVPAGAELIPGQAPGGGAVRRSDSVNGNQVIELKLPPALVARKGAVDDGDASGSRLLGEGRLRAARLLVMIHGGDAGLGGRDVRFVAVTAKQQKEIAKLRLGSGWNAWPLDAPAVVEDAQVQRLLIRSGGERPIFIAAAAANRDAQPLAKELAMAANPLLPLVYDGPRGLRDLMLAATTARDAEPAAEGIELLYPGKASSDGEAAQGALAALVRGWGDAKGGGTLRWYADQTTLSTPFNDLVNRKPPILALYLRSDQPPRIFDNTISSNLVSAAKNGTIGVLIVDAGRAASRQRAEWDAWLAKLHSDAPGVAVMDLDAAVAWLALPNLPPVTLLDDAGRDAALACGMRDLRARLVSARKEAEQTIRDQQKNKRRSLIGQ
jgi:hypothetical protein